MNSLIAYRGTSKLKTIFSILMSLTFMIVWLPFLRAIFDGESYLWGLTYYGLNINGAGVAFPDFFFIIIQLFFYGLLFYGLYWMQNRKLYYALLILWFLNVFGNLIADIIINGDTMFHGDTLNVHISITWIILPLSALALLLIYFILKADTKENETAIPWSPRNKMLMLFILGPVVIQGVLFAIGETSGTTDQIGVIMSIIQCFLIPLIFRPKVN
jgi:hypothetical protein